MKPMSNWNLAVHSGYQTAGFFVTKAYMTSLHFYEHCHPLLRMSSRFSITWHASGVFFHIHQSVMWCWCVTLPISWCGSRAPLSVGPLQDAAAGGREHEGSLVLSMVRGPCFLSSKASLIQRWCLFSPVRMTRAFSQFIMWFSLSVISDGWLVALMLCLFFYCSFVLLLSSSHTPFCLLFFCLIAWLAWCFICGVAFVFWGYFVLRMNQDLTSVGCGLTGVLMVYFLIALWTRHFSHVRQYYHSSVFLFVFSLLPVFCCICFWPVLHLKLLPTVDTGIFSVHVVYGNIGGKTHCCNL